MVTKCTLVIVKQTKNVAETEWVLLQGAGKMGSQTNVTSMYLAADNIKPLKNSCTLVKLGEGHGPRDVEGVTNLSCNLTIKQNTTKLSEPRTFFDRQNEMQVSYRLQFIVSVIRSCRKQLFASMHGFWLTITNRKQQQQQQNNLHWTRNGNKKLLNFLTVTVMSSNQRNLYRFIMSQTKATFLFLKHFNRVKVVSESASEWRLMLIAACIGCQWGRWSLHKQWLAAKG